MVGFGAYKLSATEIYAMQQKYLPERQKPYFQKA